MKIAISSQNFRTVTGHAGRARRFLVYNVGTDSTVIEATRLDLPIYMSMHDFDDRRPHPLDEAKILITGGAGDGFVHRMMRRGIRVVTTAETDPETAVHAFLAGCLKRPSPTTASECSHGAAAHSHQPTHHAHQSIGGH